MTPDQSREPLFIERLLLTFTPHIHHQSSTLLILSSFQATHCFDQTGGAASLLVELAVVLRWHLQMEGGIRPVGELGVVRVPGAFAHRHLAAGGALPVGLLHANERRVVRGLVFTGRCGGRSGPGAGGAGGREAVGSAGVQACYSHDLGGSAQVNVAHLLPLYTTALPLKGGVNPDPTWCCIRCSGKAVRGCGSSSWLLCLRRHSKLKDGLLLPDRNESAQVGVLSEASLKTNSPLAFK